MSIVKTVFKRIRGRIIPIRINVAGAPDELQKIVHVQKARAYVKTEDYDKMGAVFWKLAREQAKETGFKIARRIARLKK